MDPLVICAALTGGGPAGARTPHQPVTPQAIAAEALTAWRAGAAIVHCHARCDDGTPTNDEQVYRDLLARIQDSGCQAVVNFSAGDNGGLSGHDERLAVVGTGAEIVSLGGGSFNLGSRTYDNSPSFRLKMVQRMRDLGVTPEFELFDIGQVHGLQWLADQGLLPPRPLVTLGVGIPGALPCDLDALALAVRLLPAGAHWSVSCQGADYDTFRKIMLCAFAWGGHVRTGLEDFVYVRPGVLARSNAEMVEQWVDTATLWGRPIADAQYVRERLGIGLPQLRQALA